MRKVCYDARQHLEIAPYRKIGSVTDLEINLKYRAMASSECSTHVLDVLEIDRDGNFWHSMIGVHESTATIAALQYRKIHEMEPLYSHLHHDLLSDAPGLPTLIWQLLVSDSPLAILPQQSSLLLR